jgi:hypothetical protein
MSPNPLELMNLFEQFWDSFFWSEANQKSMKDEV